MGDRATDTDLWVGERSVEQSDAMGIAGLLPFAQYSLTLKFPIVEAANASKLEKYPFRIWQ